MKVLKTKLRILSKRQSNREKGESIDLEVDSDDLLDEPEESHIEKEKKA